MRKRRKVHKLGISVIMAWVAVGIIASLSLTAMHLTESRDLNDFYAIDVYDISNSSINVGSPGITYNVLDKVFVISGEQALKQIKIEDKSTKWNYFIVNIENMNSETMFWNIKFYDEQNKLSMQQPYTLVPGENVLPVSAEKCSTVEIIIENSIGLSFCMKNLQLRSDVPVFSWKRFTYINLVFFGGYLVLTGILWKIFKEKLRKIKWYGGIEILQKCYIKWGELIYKRVSRVSYKTRHKMITGLLCGGILYLNIIFNTNKFFVLFPIQLFLFSVLISIISVLCIEGSLHMVNWRNSAAVAWVCMSCMMCISDFMVTKTFSGTGYVFLTVLGFFYFVWNNMEQPKRFIRDTICSLHITFLVIAVFCLVCRPEMGVGRYMGAFFNPNTFGVYLVVVFAAGCESLTESLIENRKFRWKLLWCVENIAVLYFTWKTQSRASLLGVAGISMAYGIYWWKNRKGIVKGCRIYYVPVLIFLIIVQCKGMGWSINHLPYYLGTKVEMEHDVYKRKEETKESSFWTLHVQAAESSETGNRIFNKVRFDSMESFTSQRNLYWKTYLRELNLWGHASKAVVFGKKSSAHNAFLDMAYRYGVFILVPYTILWGSILVRGIRFMFADNRRYAVFPLAVGIGYLLLMPVETIEQPFAFAVWIVAYLVMGMMMRNDGESKEYAEE